MSAHYFCTRTIFQPQKGFFVHRHCLSHMPPTMLWPRHEMCCIGLCFLHGTSVSRSAIQNGNRNKQILSTHWSVALRLGLQRAPETRRENAETITLFNHHALSMDVNWTHISVISENYCIRL